VYATGGWAWNGSRYDRVVTSSPIPLLADSNANGSQTGPANGWAAGGGIEWGFAPRWSFRVEYLHAEFPSITNNYQYTVTYPPITFRTTKSVLDSDMVRIGVNLFLTP